MVWNTLQSGGEHMDAQGLNKQVMRWDDKRLSTRGMGNKTQVEQMMTASYGKPRGK